jgi:FUS-interacting serine-arginine-rich protein 1
MGRDPVSGGTSLLIRNLSRSARPEDVRYAAEKYGPVRDVYLPLDYYTK